MFIINFINDENKYDNLLRHFITNELLNFNVSELEYASTMIPKTSHNNVKQN